MKGTLASLIRLGKFNLDERRRRLADLSSLAMGLQASLKAFDRAGAVEREAAQHDIEMQKLLPHYLGMLDQRRQTVYQSLRELEAEMNTANLAITEAFRELKRYELTQEERVRQSRRHAARKEDLQLDEQAMQGYRRNAS